MPSQRVALRRSACKDLERLNTPHMPWIFAAIKGLATEPRPHGCLKLKGSEDLYRVRIGDFRVVYQIAEDLVIIVGVSVPGITSSQVDL